MAAYKTSSFDGSLSVRSDYKFVEPIFYCQGIILYLAWRALGGIIDPLCGKRLCGANSFLFKIDYLWSNIFPDGFNDYLSLSSY
jgi:hypothetical protein